MRYFFLVIVCVLISCSKGSEQQAVIDTAESYIEKTPIREIDDLYIYKERLPGKAVYKLSPFEQFRSMNEGYLPYKVFKRKGHYLLIFDKEKQALKEANIPEEFFERRSTANEYLEYNPEEWVLVVCENTGHHEVVRDAGYLPVDSLKQVQEFTCQ